MNAYHEHELDYTQNEVLEELHNFGWRMGYNTFNVHGYRPDSMDREKLHIKEKTQNEETIHGGSEYMLIEEREPQPSSERFLEEEQLQPPPVYQHPSFDMYHRMEEQYHRMEEQNWLHSTPGERILGRRFGEARVMDQHMASTNFEYTVKPIVYRTKYVEIPQVVTKEVIKKVPKPHFVERIIEVPPGGPSGHGGARDMDGPTGMGGGLFGQGIYGQSPSSMYRARDMDRPSGMGGGPFGQSTYGQSPDSLYGARDTDGPNGMRRFNGMGTQDGMYGGRGMHRQEGMYGQGGMYGPDAMYKQSSMSGNGQADNAYCEGGVFSAVCDFLCGDLLRDVDSYGEVLQNNSQMACATGEDTISHKGVLRRRGVPADLTELVARQNGEWSGAYEDYAPADLTNLVARQNDEWSGAYEGYEVRDGVFSGAGAADWADDQAGVGGEFSRGQHGDNTSGGWPVSGRGGLCGPDGSRNVPPGQGAHSGRSGGGAFDGSGCVPPGQRAHSGRSGGGPASNTPKGTRKMVGISKDGRIIQEQIVEVPQVVTKENITYVPQTQYWERTIEIPKVEFREVIEYEDQIEYREVPVDRIVVVPEIELRDVPAPEKFYESKPLVALGTRQMRMNSRASATVFWPNGSMQVEQQQRRGSNPTTAFPAQSFRPGGHDTSNSVLPNSMTSGYGPYMNSDTILTSGYGPYMNSDTIPISSRAVDQMLASGNVSHMHMDYMRGTREVPQYAKYEPQAAVAAY